MRVQGAGGYVRTIGQPRCGKCFGILFSSKCFSGPQPSRLAWLPLLSSNETYQPSERERRLISSPSEWLHSATLIKGDPDTSLLALNDGTAMSKIVSWYNQDEFVGNAEGRRDLKGGARFREIAKHNRSRSRRRLWIRTSIRGVLQRVEFHSS
jgi:hypothetical protein